jgi:hypothetical protein
MIKMSARKLQEILAGKITVQEYIAAYDTPREKLETNNNGQPKFRSAQRSRAGR